MSALMYHRQVSNAECAQIVDEKKQLQAEADVHLAEKSRLEREKEQLRSKVKQQHDVIAKCNKEVRYPLNLVYDVKFVQTL